MPCKYIIGYRKKGTEPEMINVVIVDNNII